MSGGYSQATARVRCRWCYSPEGPDDVLPSARTIFRACHAPTPLDRDQRADRRLGERPVWSLRHLRSRTARRGRCEYGRDNDHHVGDQDRSATGRGARPAGPHPRRDSRARRRPATRSRACGGSTSSEITNCPDPAITIRTPPSLAWSTRPRSSRCGSRWRAGPAASLPRPGEW